MKITAEEVLQCQITRNRINECNLKDIVLLDKEGNEIKVDNDAIHNWKYTGLNNYDLY